MRFRAAALAAIVCSLPLIALSQARAGAAAPSAQSGTKVPVVDVVEVSGVIDATISEYIANEIRSANRRRAELLVISISSAGGLNIRTESLLRLIEGSATPIAVFVGPQRAQAAGTAALLVAASHVAVIGPSGRLGPAHPTNLAIDPKSPRGRALHTATKEQIDRFAAARGRAPGVYLDRSIPQTRAILERQVDFAATGVDELLRKANGRTVNTAAGDRTLRLESDAVDLRFHKPGPWRRVVHSLINPSLVYILLIAGVLLIVFEIFQPGFGVAGVTGALLLVGAVYGLIALPTALWAIFAFAAGCVLLSLDVAVDGLGLPTYVGLAGFTAGSAGLFSAPADELRIAWWLWVLGGVLAFVFFVPVMTVVRRARQPINRNVDASLVGRPGQVRSMLNPEGYVWVADAIWRARSDGDERIRVGEDVTVTGIDGVVLTVRRV